MKGAAHGVDGDIKTGNTAEEVVVRGVMPARACFLLTFGPPPPSGTRHSMLASGTLMLHVLQWMQF